MITAPFPGIGDFNYFCPYGIEEHIPAELKAVAVLIDDDRLEPALQDMSCSLVPPIVFLSIYAVEMLHSAGKVFFGGLDHQSLNSLFRYGGERGSLNELY